MSQRIEPDQIMTHLQELQNFNSEIETDVDVSQLQRNLEMNVEKRLLEHQSSLDLALELAKAGRHLYEQA